MANSVWLGPFGMSFNGSSYTFPFPVLLPDGTAAAPSLAFASDAGTSSGWVKQNAQTWALVSSATGVITFSSNPASGIRISSNLPFSWASGDTFTTGPDVLLFRDAANTLALRNGTNAQQFNVGPVGNLISLIGSVTGAASYIEGIEGTAPAAGAANTGRIFFQDNGGGKTQLMVIFNSGAAQQIALQP